MTHTWESNRDALDIKENKVGSTVISAYDYGVNAIGQRAGVAQAGTAFGSSRSIAWGYDGLGQVTRADHSTNNAFDVSFEYDAIGNFKKAGAGLTPPAGSNYTANALNQYTAMTGYSPTYDDDGNLLTDGGGNHHSIPRSYTWDAENRLVQAREVAGSVVIGTYAYDAFGRRVARTALGATTLYHYEGWNVIGEYQSGILQRAHVWGLDLSGTLQGAGGVGGLLCTHIAGAKYYPLYDDNGNVGEYLNSAGSVVAHYEYGPFGYPIYTTGASSALFDIRFSTKKRDAETEFHYYGYRYYSAWMARWLNRDPIEEEGGVNLYAFLENDGTNAIDLLGLYDPQDPNHSNPTHQPCESSGYTPPSCNPKSWLSIDASNARDIHVQIFPTNGKNDIDPTTGEFKIIGHGDLDHIRAFVSVTVDVKVTCSKRYENCAVVSKSQEIKGVQIKDATWKMKITIGRGFKYAKMGALIAKGTNSIPELVDAIKYKIKADEICNKIL